MQRSSGHLEEVVFYKNQPQRSLPRRDPAHQLSCRVFIACNKVTYTCSSMFLHSKWCSTHSKQRDHTVRQVIAYYRFRIIKKYRTVNPKVVVVAYEIWSFTRAFIKGL